MAWETVVQNLAVLVGVEVRLFVLFMMPVHCPFLSQLRLVPPPLVLVVRITVAVDNIRTLGMKRRPVPLTVGSVSMQVEVWGAEVQAQGRTVLAAQAEMYRCKPQRITFLARHIYRVPPKATVWLVLVPLVEQAILQAITMLSSAAVGEDALDMMLTTTEGQVVIASSEQAEVVAEATMNLEGKLEQEGPGVHTVLAVLAER